MENFNEEENVSKEYDSKLMRRLIKFSKPFKWYIVFVIFLMLIVTALDLARPYLIKTAIDNNIGSSNKPYTALVSVPSNNNFIKIGDYYVTKGKLKNGIPCNIKYDGSNYFIQSKDSSKISSYKLSTEEIKKLRSDDVKGIEKIAILILIISVSIFFLNYIQIFILQYTGQKIIFEIRQQLFKHIESLSLSFFDKNPVGRLVTRVTNDVETLNEMYTSVLVSLFKDVFLIGGILIAMFVMNWRLGIITLCSIPFILIAAAIFKKYDRGAYRDVRTRLAKINSSLSENISGIKTVQIYGKEEKKFNEFSKVNKDYLKANMKQLTVFAVFRPSIDLLFSLTLSALLWFGGMKVIQSKLPFGVLFAFISYLMQFFQPVFDMTEKYDILQSAMAASERIFMLLDTENSIKNIDKPMDIGRINGDVEFKNVWFAYNEDNWVLRDVSFKINKGEKIAFVGATGAGKTSIISLINRLYDIQKGEILIDGMNIKEMDKYQLRRNISVVLQDVFLFTGDVKSNVRLNNENISDEKVIESLKYVNADKFIEKLPDKYDSKVNERGTTFSQGQRQLVAFARAIAFDPPVLVLDEATSNIDTETESLIQDALKKITNGRTTIIVAHRLSTIKNSDRIIVLHKGKIREEGTHEELIKKEGLYYNLYKLQYSQQDI